VSPLGRIASTQVFGSYSELRLDHIMNTLQTLERRIVERFPDSGLRSVAAELTRIGADTNAVIDRYLQPHRGLRALIYFGVAIIIALAIITVAVIPDYASDAGIRIGDLLQAIESAAQSLIFLSVAIYFLLTLETRVNRRISLRALHRLRSIVHIVDMHQLTKDPEHLRTPGMETASSPERSMTRFELARYLDYCSELLSLSSKLAALHVQYVNDPVVLGAVNDIEVLAANLANKIWQKIVILDTSSLITHAPAT
jgi:hypothetical protein